MIKRLNFSCLFVPEGGEERRKESVPRAISRLSKGGGGKGGAEFCFTCCSKEGEKALDYLSLLPQCPEKEEGKERRKDGLFSLRGRVVLQGRRRDLYRREGRASLRVMGKRGEGEKEGNLGLLGVPIDLAAASKEKKRFPQGRRGEGEKRRMNRPYHLRTPFALQRKKERFDLKSFTLGGKEREKLRTYAQGGGRGKSKGPSILPIISFVMEKEEKEERAHRGLIQDIAPDQLETRKEERKKCGEKKSITPARRKGKISSSITKRSRGGEAGGGRG